MPFGILGLFFETTNNTSLKLKGSGGQRWLAAEIILVPCGCPSEELVPL